MSAVPAHFADVLDRLKAETRGEHTAMEDALDVMRDDFSLGDYRQLLERYFRLDFETRRKLPLLRADLAALGGRAEDTLAVGNALPPLHTPAQAVGCLYVLEGATLGGQIISRHVRRTLGLTPETGARFFHGNGARTADMWRTFRAALDGFAADPATADAVVESANATFRSMRRWCLAGHAP
jgi:heme oxygenase